MVGLTASAALASLLGWAASAAPGFGLLAWAGVALACLAVLALAKTLLRPVRGSLRWSGSDWLFVVAADAAAPAAEPESGRLEVDLDFGRFMLLRWRRHALGGGSAAARWMAVDARSVSGDWHAFRCAAYAPRAATGPDGLPAGERF